MSNKQIFLGTLATILLFATSALAQVWSGPTQAPPAGNVATPLNVSNFGQSKLGGLKLNGTDFGLLVPFGKVGIGTLSPSQALDVSGNVRATKAHIDQVCNRANPTQCLNFSDIANTIVPGGGAIPVINSFSVTPSPVVWGQSVTFNGIAAGGPAGSQNCITRHRAYIGGSQGGAWIYVANCPSTLTLNGSVVTDYNQRSFYLSNNPYTSNTYSVLWEVQGVSQGVTSVVPLTVVAQGAPSVTSFIASPTTAISGITTVAFSGSATQGTACIIKYRLLNVSGSSQGDISVANCPSPATISVSYPASSSLFVSSGPNLITLEVVDSAGNVGRQTVTVDVWPQGGPTINSFTLRGGNQRGLVHITASATRGQYCITGYSVGPSEGQTPSSEDASYDTISASPTDCPQYVNIDADIGGYYDAFGPRDLSFTFSVGDSQGNVVSQDQTIGISQ